MGKTPFQEMQELMSSILAVRYTDAEKERADCLSLLEIATREGNLYCTAFAHTYLGDYYISQNDTEHCGEHLQLARELALENSFQQLLIQIYNLLGICYESLSDEPTAVQFYLDALDLVNQNQTPDPYMHCVLYNNIGNNFEFHHNYETARTYYQKALEHTDALRSGSDRDTYVLLRLWNNMVEVYRRLEDLDSVKHFLHLSETLVTTNEECKELVLCQGWCCYYADLGQAEKAGHFVDRLLDGGSADYSDRYFLFQVLTVMCDALISLGDRGHARQLLELIFLRCSPEEQERMLSVRRIHVSFCEAFGTEAERTEAYRDYYRAVQAQADLSHQVCVGNMKTILHLHDVCREKEEVLREKQGFESMASLDELTQLYNRRHFNKLISKSISGGVSAALGFIMLDVDFFKEYNDTYGHAHGDDVLRSVAYALQASAPPGIAPCRYGGDEFVCLCSGCADAVIEDYIQRVRTSIAALALGHTSSPCSDRITLSIGYSNGFAASHWSVDALLEAADQALYKSKLAGRNTYTRAEKI